MSSTASITPSAGLSSTYLDTDGVVLSEFTSIFEAFRGDVDMYHRYYNTKVVTVLIAREVAELLLLLSGSKKKDDSSSQ